MMFLIFALLPRASGTPVGKAQTPEPLLHFDCLDIRQTTGAPTRKNPFLQIALVCHIARKSESGWTVAFGHLNDQRDRFIVEYEGIQGTTLQEFTVRKADPPREDTSFYLAAANRYRNRTSGFSRRTEAVLRSRSPSSFRATVRVRIASTDEGRGFPPWRRCTVSHNSR